MVSRIYITARQFQLITSKVEANPSCEICGVLGGVHGVVRGVYVVSNIADSPSSAFLMDPKQLFRIMLYLDKMGFQVLAFFHSHPEGSSSILSARDVLEHYYPDTLSIVLTPQNGRLASFRVFHISGQATREFPIQIFGD